MDPRPLTPEQWEQVRSLLTYLVAGTGLALNAGLAYLLAQAVIPSLVLSAEASPNILVYRRVLLPVFWLSLGLTLYALARAMALAVQVLLDFYPRFAI